VADADSEFMTLGVQYYTIGRSAVLAGLVPVCGNLLHHAVEMFLKAKLSRSRTPQQLKKMRHKLVVLWNAFKAEFPGEALGQFDDPIAALDRFEEIRYPDSIVNKGAVISIEWERWDRSPFPTGTGTVSGTARTPPQYESTVADIDRLVGKIFEISSRNPVFFTGGLNTYARDAITRNNPVAEKLVEGRP
jgi:hypothetical protein